ncbi:hypothetical protein DM01DRAFT_1369845 [Hesseltinella vesiculosa]|uniref:C2H2-type domain-containing protein n=1 Tax=Hesseltinella vesiculosa TaxID=101127 RepID=A0A1X2GV58_9FUNG|nr:hypothetical protein DM01DRAFT_1369845 [Hesseltinella vesiculosa]
MSSTKRTGLPEEEVDSLDCRICDQLFDNKNAFYQHRRREHVLQANVILGDYTVSVPFESGRFRCPLACCPAAVFKNVDTLKAHMTKQHNSNVEVTLYSHAIEMHGLEIRI